MIRVLLSLEVERSTSKRSAQTKDGRRREDGSP